MNIQSDLKYTKSHEWSKTSAATARFSALTIMPRISLASSYSSTCPKSATK